MGISWKPLLAVLSLVFPLSVYAQVEWDVVWDPEGFGTPTFAEWIKLEQRRSLDFLYKNISAPDAAPGSVVASPSRTNPNYFFHWVRDAALSMDPLVRIFQSTQQGVVKQRVFNQIHQYVLFSRKLQLTPNLSQGLGEPKFYPDGRAFDGNWGRPQNDGPALRALSLIRFAQHLLTIDHEDYVRQYLYDAQQPSESLVKADLDFVARQWHQKSFDLWEEVLGDHFFTQLVQRRALVEGARLAERLQDPESAQMYREQAKLLTVEIEKFWNADLGVIVPSRNVIRGPWKPRGLDVSVILASILAQGSDEFFSPSDDRVLSTAAHLVTFFHNLYPVNFDRDFPGTALGRYPEDAYDGVSVGSQGNPWFIATEAMAELVYYAKRNFLKAGGVKISDRSAGFFKLVLPSEDFVGGTELARGDPLWDDLMAALLRYGDSFLARVAFHLDRSSGAMTEQFHRDTGFMQGAKDLSWSYAGFLTASWARRVALAPQ